MRGTGSRIYEIQMGVVFDRKRVLEAYCQDDVRLFREACCLLMREFIHIGNIDVFLESHYCVGM